MVINLRCADAVLGKELRNLDVMPVLLALEVVFHQDQRLLRRAANPIKSPVRAAFLDRQDLYILEINARKVQTRAAQKKIGGHSVRCRGRDERRRLFGGCGQYSFGADFVKQFVHPATKLCRAKSHPLRRCNFPRQQNSRAVRHLDERGRYDAPPSSSSDHWRDRWETRAPTGRGAAANMSRDFQRPTNFLRQ